MRKITLMALAAALVVGANGCVLSPAAQAAPFTCNEYHDGDTFDGNGVAPPGRQCWIQNATITGNVTVQSGTAGGNLFFGYGTIDGNVNVQSRGIADIEGETLGGNVTNNGGALHIGDSGLIKGNVYSTNAVPTGKTSLSPATYPFGYQYSVLICNTGIDGDVVATGSASHVVVGDDHQCGPNRIGGNVNVSGNNGVDFVNGPQQYCSSDPDVATCGIGGNVAVNNNRGTTTDEPQSAQVIFNTIGGNLGCAGNVNGADTGDNTVAGNTTGQCIP